MEKEDFIMREVTLEGEYGVSVTRSRNSKGWASVSVQVKTKKAGKNSKDHQSMTFDKGTYGDNYEMVAREVASVLVDICDNPCALPKVGE